MNKNIFTTALATLALAGTLVSATALPASADQQASTRLIAGAAALAAIATAVNVENKHRAATSVIGYLPDGSAVYQDGHVVSANNGQSWYPSNYGQQVACNSNQCYVTGNNNGYNGYGYNGYNNGYGYGYNNGNYNNSGYGYNGTQGYRRHHHG